MTLHSLSLTLHLLSAVIWVGGMIFAYQFLRPVAAQQLEPPQRLQLWVGVFGRFFPVVWTAIILLPLTGYYMLFDYWGSFANTPVYVHIMNGVGTLMILIYMHVFFAPYKRLRAAVAIQDWPAAGKQLNMIRKLVGVNATLGLIVIITAGLGRCL